MDRLLLKYFYALNLKMVVQAAHHLRLRLGQDILKMVCHTISICLTLILAVWRYVAVARPQQNRAWCSYRRTIFAISIAYIFCPVLCIPLFIKTKVREQVEILDSDGESVKAWNKSFIGNTTNTTLYVVQTEVANDHDILKNLNFWIYSVVIKLFPCAILTIVSLKLLQVLLEAKQRRQKLINVHDQNVEKKDCCRRMDKERQTDRTTKMLLTVLLLFLVTELPQGILGLLSVLLGQGFFRTCYLMLANKYLEKALNMIDIEKPVVSVWDRREGGDCQLDGAIGGERDDGQWWGVGEAKNNF
ncbi:hypothetical protein WN48_04410 [Eufriesea mexicana]|uniref:G-protein coupled receptors family 1 profile domain-containing protein n=1 Tax=Eufriesea mexicana TaxID=516756 RepID=A0A310SJC9_9HYME|nr:hypothetical protein WN48_04410 [Eufriesea mexicana]